MVRGGKCQQDAELLSDPDKKVIQSISAPEFRGISFSMRPWILRFQNGCKKPNRNNGGTETNFARKPEAAAIFRQVV